MKTALVTGASSGIGLAISKYLLQQDYIVYGIGRVFKQHIDNDNFHPLIIDLLDIDTLLKQLNNIDLSNLSLLINNAGVAYYGLHDTLSVKNISEINRINLEIPMILTNILMKYIHNNEGTIINISSISGTMQATHGAAYGASKAGLIAFSKSLFAEYRKYNIKVSCIIADLCDTNLYRHANFKPDNKYNSTLLVDDIVNAIDYILTNRNGININEITIRPQLNHIIKK